jgi:hypothetical protein
VIGKSLPEALRSAQPIPFERDLVLGCLDPEKELDRRFARAFSGSLAALRPEERRGGLAGITGHVAEAVIESVLVEHRWNPVWDLPGSGLHGVDLLFLDPHEQHLFAVEVKATLRPGHWPRFRSEELRQMSAAWLDKPDNPGMVDWTVGSEDVYGAVALVNFHESAFKAAMTADLESWLSVRDSRQLDDLDWATRR